MLVAAPCGRSEEDTMLMLWVRRELGVKEGLRTCCGVQGRVMAIGVIENERSSIRVAWMFVGKYRGIARGAVA